MTRTQDRLAAQMDRSWSHRSTRPDSRARPQPAATPPLIMFASPQRTADSWWTTADQPGFTACALKRRAAMEASAGAKLLRLIEHDSANNFREIRERKGGKWA